MNRSEKICELKKRYNEPVQILERKEVLGGLFSFNKSRGWLSFEDRGDHWSVILTNDKYTHEPLNGDALGADFLKETGERKIGPLSLTGAWRTSLTMHPVRDEEKAVQVFNYIAGMVDRAYQQYC